MLKKNSGLLLQQTSKGLVNSGQVVIRVQVHALLGAKRMTQFKML